MTLQEQLDALAKENAMLKRKLEAQAISGLSLRVSEKGALSVYGLGRFPITMYKSQWVRLLEISVVESIRSFIKDNDSKLTTKS